MSKVVVLPVDVFQVEGLSIYEQMCYMVIRSFMNGKTKVAFPSYDTIAKLGRMSRRKAIDCVKVLVEKGLLKKECRPSTEDKKDHSSNVYQFPSEPHAPSGERENKKPSEPHAPKHNYKNLLTNKVNKSHDIPIWILNQQKESDQEQCTEEQKKVLSILLEQTEKLAM